MSEPVLKMADHKSEDSHTSRRDKFIELAEKRTINAIKAIRVIGKLGNRSAYEYDDEDVRKIVKALNDEIEAVKSRMKSTKRSDGVDFKL
jgi:N-methylhydantoinase B/oxoprolinase/acetone carboxylase alpha subunit